jgi:hypothetical protein
MDARLLLDGFEPEAVSARGRALSAKASIVFGVVMVLGLSYLAASGAGSSSKAIMQARTVSLLSADNGVSESLNAKITAAGFIDPNDAVAISFWIISISMVAATVFFLMQATCVTPEWKTSLHVGALVTLVAAVHYFYMREFWVQIHTSPILYRYIDWSITVPLQMIEFYLILSAVKVGTQGMFFRLLLGTVAMLAFGYMGEAQFLWPSVGFVLGMAGWAFILYEIFTGEAGQVAASGVLNKYVQQSFSTMRFIVTIGWSIYPLGYFFGYLMGAVNDDILNLVYNLADFVNKIAFCLAIWQSAKNSTLEGQSH